MSDLFEKIEIARAKKPAEGEPCNHCGWCCLTEVCPVGQELLKSQTIPCALLVVNEKGQFCSIANDKVMQEIVGIGTGCDAITQQEKLEMLGIAL